MISFFRNLSIGLKINLILVVTSLTAMLAMGTALWHFQSRSYQENLEANLLSAAMIIADNSASSIIFEDPDTANEILSSLKNIPGFSSALLYNHEKVVLAYKGSEGSLSDIDHLEKESECHHLGVGQKTEGFVEFGDGFALVDQPIHYGEKNIGALHMVFSLDPLVRQKIQLARFLALVFTGALLLIVLVGHGLQKLISGPLVRLAQTVVAVSREKDYALRVDVTSKDETGQLTESFNQMLTTIQEHEESLVRSVEEADRANKTKGLFLANMSHEIRTPMNGIIGMSDLLLDSEMTADQKGSLDIIRQSGEQLLAIINEILDFSKVESGKMVLENETLDLARIIDSVAKMMEPTANRKGLRIVTILDKELPKTVSGDPVRLRQILINLMGNAVKFSSSGDITFSVEKLSTAEGSAAFRFEVIDRGIGIPADQLEKIFSQFTQVDDSYTRSYGGTGLGLAICKHLVELMDGTIGVTSTIGEGSTFWFEIELAVLEDPLPDPETTPEEARVFEETDQKSSSSTLNDFPISHILVAEDNKFNQMVISKILHKLGCKVDVAENGKEAVALLQDAETPYDLVFMDCHMPLMDGFQATQAIRNLSGSGSRTPVVALTASAMPEDQAKALACKMDDYLTKPVYRGILQDALKKWVWGGSSSSQAITTPSDKSHEVGLACADGKHQVQTHKNPVSSPPDQNLTQKPTSGLICRRTATSD